MSIAYESPGFAAAERASLNPPDRFLTTREENAIEAALEQRAEDEADDLAAPFLEWLANDSGFAALKSRYVRFRVNAFGNDVRAAVEREVIGE